MGDTTNNTGGQWAQLGMQAAGGAVAQGMGMLLGNYNDRRQRMQQDKLWQMEMKNRKEMTDYEMEKQYEMWQKTNYGAQMEELKKAGLNPGLLYGMGGQGGMSTGHSSGNISGAEAPKGGGEPQAMMGMMIQSQMTAAQIELIKAQTAKTNTETTKIGGVDTEESKTRMASLMQGVTESKAKTALTNVQTTIAELDAQLKGKTIDEQQNIIEWTASKIFRELQIADDAQYVSHATRNTRVDIVRGELESITLRNALTKAETDLTGAQTDLTKAHVKLTDQEIEAIKVQMDVMLTELDQKWQKLRIDEQEMYIKSYMAKVGAAALPMQALTQAATSILLIRNAFPDQKAARTVVEGFRKNK